jgi:hypothetical protein
MKTVLRDSLAGLYHGGNQAWCAEVSGGLNFDSIRTAARAAQEQELESVNVVLRYEEPTCALVLPLALCIFNVVGGRTNGQHPRHPD